MIIFFHEWSKIRSTSAYKQYDDRVVYLCSYIQAWMPTSSRLQESEVDHPRKPSLVTKSIPSLVRDLSISRGNLSFCRVSFFFVKTFCHAGVVFYKHVFMHMLVHVWNHEHLCGCHMHMGILKKNSKNIFPKSPKQPILIDKCQSAYKGSN